MQVVCVDTKRCLHDLVKGQEDDSINSWRELCDEFTSHFTVRQKQPKTMATLNAIVQDKKENLREYVERFTREGVEVHGANDGLKCFIIENNLRDDCKFKEELGIHAAKDMSNLNAIIQYLIIANNVRPQIHKFWSILIHKHGVRFDTPTTSQI